MTVAGRTALSVDIGSSRSAQGCRRKMSIRLRSDASARLLTVTSSKYRISKSRIVVCARARRSNGITVASNSASTRRAHIRASALHKNDLALDACPFCRACTCHLPLRFLKVAIVKSSFDSDLRVTCLISRSILRQTRNVLNCWRHKGNEVAHPTGFEPVASAFGGLLSRCQRRFKSDPFGRLNFDPPLRV